MMNKSFTIRMISLLSCLMSFISLQADSAEKRPWAILTIIAADNSLSDFVNLDLQEMLAAAAPDKHILAFVNTKQSEVKSAQKLVVNQQGIVQDGDSLLNLDSGAQQTVKLAVQWAIENYPSDRMMINFWNHGKGPLKKEDCCDFNVRNVCYDDTTGSSLNDKDLQDILIYAQQLRGKKMDIVAFDACLMAGIELMAIVRPYAEYYIASQETIPGQGFAYQGVINSLNALASTKDITVNIVESYKKEYQYSGEDFTLSSVTLSETDALVENIEYISTLLLSALNSTSKITVSHALKLAAFGNENIRFQVRDYIDLYSFYLNVYRNIPIMILPTEQKNTLSAALYKGLKLIMKAVEHEVSSHRYYAVRGISIYLPFFSIDDSYQTLLWKNKAPHWFEFLQKMTLLNIA